jgi:hypothetical protein
MVPECLNLTIENDPNDTGILLKNNNKPFNRSKNGDKLYQNDVVRLAKL